MTDNRLVTGAKKEADAFEATIRPQSLAEFIGQEQARANLEIFIKAAKARGDALDHVLFAGPPGLGKTTLAQIMAKEMGVGFRATSGPVISKAGDLAALLTNLEERDVLFIDEIHRLNPAVEEILYPAMEDYQLDLIIGEGPAARSVRIDLAKFTLVGATTRAGLLTNPLRDRFGIPVRLNFYTIDELELVVSRGARVLGAPMARDGAREIARRARGTPRIAGRLLRRVRDFAAVAGAGMIDAAVADKALRMLEVDNEGLDALDHRYLNCIAKTYDGGPVGIETHGGGALGAARRAGGDRRAISVAAGVHRPDAARARADHEGLSPPRNVRSLAWCGSRSCRCSTTATTAPARRASSVMIDRRTMLKWMAGLGVSGFALGGYALAEPFRLNVTRYRIAPPRLAAGIVAQTRHSRRPACGRAVDAARRVSSRSSLRPTRSAPTRCCCSATSWLDTGSAGLAGRCRISYGRRRWRGSRRR